MVCHILPSTPVNIQLCELVNTNTSEPFTVNAIDYSNHKQSEGFQTIDNEWLISPIH